jgi:hypothetical protein
VVAALAGGPMPVVSWEALANEPALAGGFDHLVALDPPPAGVADPVLSVVPCAHLAWGMPEADFAICVYRAAFDLRPQLTQVYRDLRALGEPEAALRGPGRYPRSASACARLLAVLTELGLIAFDLEARSVRIADAARSDLELSATYRASRDRLAAIERALAPELPQPLAQTG